MYDEGQIKMTMKENQDIEEKFGTRFSRLVNRGRCRKEEKENLLRPL